jgi:hypothetical protein
MALKRVLSAVIYSIFLRDTLLKHLFFIDKDKRAVMSLLKAAGIVVRSVVAQLGTAPKLLT